MTWQLPLILLIVFELLADICAKEYQGTLRWYMALGAILLYVTANSFWLLSLRQGATLSIGATIFSVASAALAVFVGVCLYKETVSVHQWIGIGLGIVSLMLVTWEG
jgi:multidrug transporter EmrE-like cation transporter